MTIVEETRKKLIATGKVKMWRSPLQQLAKNQHKNQTPSLATVLQKDVPQKYFLSQKMQQRFHDYLCKKDTKSKSKIMGTVTTAFGRSGCSKEELRMIETISKYENPSKGGDGKIHTKNDVCQCLEGGTSGGGGTSNRPIIVGSMQKHASIMKDCSTTLTSAMGDGGGHIPMVYIRDGFKSRDNLKESEICPTLQHRSGTGGNNLPFVKISNFHHRETEFKDLSPTLKARDYKDPKVVGTSTRIIGNVYEKGGQAGEVFDVKGISKTIVPAKRGGSAVMPIICSPYGGFSSDETTGTIGTGTGTSLSKTWYVVNGLRRLTPTECCRLQAFPDSWCDIGIDEDGKEIKISDTNKYKMMGNAITTSVVKAIAEKCLK